MPRNFLLGFGERLTEKMDPPKTQMNKTLPYSFSESVKRLSAQLSKTSKSIKSLPDLACPRNQTVVSFVLHPEFTAKSYYPELLFRTWDLEQVGSRMTKIKPEKWTKKRAETETYTTEIFVSIDKERLDHLPEMLLKIDPHSAAGDELSKIEKIEPLSISEKLMPISASDKRLTFEVVLHASTEKSYLVEGFKNYINSIDSRSLISEFIFSKGLCFLSLEAPKSKAQDIVKYSFLRVLREMPRLRSFEPALRSENINFKVDLPDIRPVDPNLKIAVFDGGLPNNSVLSKWVNKKEVGNIGKPLPLGLDHGQWVSSAFLFGPLEEGESLPRPYSYVDLYRVFDKGDEKDANLIKVLRRIKNILASTNYNFVNISCGPDIPMEDTDVHAWTSVLDEVFSDGSVLATLAAGNNGHLDKPSGNARIQPPSDCVNGLCVGAADRQGSPWKKAGYSCIGPGRLPGYIKPDILGFGGSTKEPFWVVKNNSGHAVPVSGTSFAAPLALRVATGIRATFGNNLSPLAIKALLIHSCESNSEDISEIGWGKLDTNIDSITSSLDHCIKVVYQGKLSPGEWLKVPIPLPNSQIKGRVWMKATICYATPTDPQDPANYTQSGLEIVFRPNDSKKSKPGQENADTKSFFSSSKLYKDLDADEKRHDSHRWETTSSSSVSMLGSSLKNPEFNVHYIARNGGNKSKEAQEIPYALVVEVDAPRETNLYNQVFSRFRTTLEILKPTIEVEVKI